ncbi:putative reverse transcriptase domain-containing protein [Tanacetum coccineum]
MSCHRSPSSLVLILGRMRMQGISKVEFWWDKVCKGVGRHRGEERGTLLLRYRNWKLRIEYSAKSGRLLASISGLFSGRRVTCEYLRSRLEGKWNWIDPRAIKVNLLHTILAQVGNQGNVGNQNGNVINENVQENIWNVLVNGNRVGCSYKEFLAYNRKEYDGKGGAVVLTRWIEKMEYNHAMVEAGHVAYTDRFHELARLVPHLVTPESRKIERYVYGLAPQIRGMVAAIEPKTMQKAVQISGALTDEAVRNGSTKKVEKIGNIGEHSNDKNGRDDKKRTRTRNVFATTANPVGKENTGAWPKCTTCNSYHAPGGTCRTCFNCNHPGHIARDFRVVPRIVNPVNVRNPTPARGACHECGSTDHLKPACPRLNRAQGPEGNRSNQVVSNNEGQGRGN